MNSYNLKFCILLFTLYFGLTHNSFSFADDNSVFEIKGLNLNLTKTELSKIGFKFNDKTCRYPESSSWNKTCDIFFVGTRTTTTTNVISGEGSGPVTNIELINRGYTPEEISKMGSRVSSSTFALDYPPQLKKYTTIGGAQVQYITFLLDEEKVVSIFFILIPTFNQKDLIAAVSSKYGTPTTLKGSHPGLSWNGSQETELVYVTENPPFLQILSHPALVTMNKKLDADDDRSKALKRAKNKQDF